MLDAVRAGREDCARCDRSGWSSACSSLARSPTERPPARRLSRSPRQLSASGSRATQAGLGHLPPHRRETAEQLLAGAELAAERIEQGIRLLERGGEELEAFVIANRAVAAGAAKRLQNAESLRGGRSSSRSCCSISPSARRPGDDPASGDRRPALLPDRRWKNRGVPGAVGVRDRAAAPARPRRRRPGGRGRVGDHALHAAAADARPACRAAGLVCALELEREAAPSATGRGRSRSASGSARPQLRMYLGRKGDSATDTARAKVRQFKSDPRASRRRSRSRSARGAVSGSRRSRSRCCQTADHPRELRIVCTNLECDFNGERSLPIVAVDEPLYRRLPAFLIATVDKFATLPWVGPSGRAARRRRPVRRGTVSRWRRAGARNARCPAPLPPPDLVIQDELHLISGPLGTMAALYEMAIDGLCRRRSPASGCGPKSLPPPRPCAALRTRSRRCSRDR